MDDFPNPATPKADPWHENPYYVLPGSFVVLILVLGIFFLLARSEPNGLVPAVEGSPAGETTAVSTLIPSPTPSPAPTNTSIPSLTPAPSATASAATAVPPTATPVPPTATPVPPTVTRVPPTATPVPPTATAIPRPVGGFPELALDAWELPGQEFCQGGQGYRAIFMEGHGGSGLYTYYWNDEPVSEPLFNQSFTYQAKVGAGSSQGQAKVISNDNKIAIVILFLPGHSCPD